MFIEQPDRIGRTLLIGIAVWTGVGLGAFTTLRLVFPTPSPALAGSHPGCKSSVPSGAYDPSDDLARPVIGAPSRCSASGSAPEQSLHAYLDGAELDGTPSRPSPPVDAALLGRGAHLYERHCAACHGASGDGAGPDGCALDTPAAIHKSGVYALRTTEHEALPTDQDLFRTITRGIHGTAMPPWFVLPEPDRWALVAHVKSLSNQFAEDVAPPPLELTRQPSGTPERIAAGRGLFATRGCASCHGDTGHGDGAAGRMLTVVPRDFTRGRFHRGSSATDIHATLATGLDGTPMASFAKVMTDDEMWNVSLFVQSLAPAMTEHNGARCPDVARALDTQELFGVRHLLHESGS